MFVTNVLLNTQQGYKCTVTMFKRENTKKTDYE